MDPPVASAAAAATVSPRARLDSIYAGVLACFLLSGFAALLYQTAWMRLFSVVFGTSELAVATVLAAYMGGLAAGAAVAGRFANRVRRPVLVYGLLELGIALAALAVPAALALLRDVQVAWIGGQPEPPDAGALTHTLFYLLGAFVVLAVPTALMGATLPLLARQAVRSREQIGRRVGVLYAVNTAGAVFGTLAAAFLLLPSLGLRGTVSVGVAANALVFVIAVALSRKALPPPTAEAAAAAALREGSAEATIPRAVWILPLIAISGAVSFAYEVLWTRLLSHLTGGTVYAFATMLASFLTGIALGSAVAARLARSPRLAARGFIGAQVGTAVLSALIYLAMDSLPALAGQGSRWRDAGISIVVLLPATLCIGATFPFALRVLARDPAEVGSASGRVFAWNTVGAIAGAIGAGFFLIPAAGFDGTVRAAILVNLLLALATAGAFAGFTMRTRSVLAALAAAVVLLFQPGPPLRLLQSSLFLEEAETDARVVFSAVGRSASVMMVERRGSYRLRTNGLPEASIHPPGSVPVGQNQRWLSVFPVIARPATRSLLMIGFGGGVGLEAVPPTIQTVDCIELEPEVIAANRAIGPYRQIDPLSDPRLTLVENDARGALSLTSKRWDAIVSQPSHPWTAGASHLYTREFMQQAREHLNPGGVFVQWMSSRFLDAELFASFSATLLDVFAEVRLYRLDPTFLLFLASDAPLDIERDIAATGEPFASQPDFYSRLGFNIVEDVAVMMTLEREGLAQLAAGAPLTTDDENLLAMRSSPVVAGSLSIDGADELFRPLDTLAASDSGLVRDLDLDRVYLAARAADLGLVARAVAMADQTSDEPDRALAAGGVLAIGRDYEQAARSYLRAWQAAPDDPDARYMIIEPSLPELALGQAPADVAAIAEGLPDPWAAVVEGARFAQTADWRRLADLDARLAQARPTDLCFFDAVRLRAIWRCYVASPEHRRTYGAAALDLIDRALAVHPEELSFQVRVRAAVAADRADALLETCLTMARFIEEGPLAESTLPEVRDEIRAVIREALRVLPTLSEPAGYPQRHAEELQGHLASLAANES